MYGHLTSEMIGCVSICWGNLYTTVYETRTLGGGLWQPCSSSFKGLGGTHFAPYHPRQDYLLWNFLGPNFGHNWKFCNLGGQFLLHDAQNLMIQQQMFFKSFLKCHLFNCHCLSLDLRPCIGRKSWVGQHFVGFEDLQLTEMGQLICGSFMVPLKPPLWYFFSESCSSVDLRILYFIFQKNQLTFDHFMNFPKSIEQHNYWGCGYSFYPHNLSLIGSVCCMSPSL